MEKSWQQKAMGLAAGLVVIAVGILLVIKPRQSLDTLAVIISVGILVMAVINGVGAFINRHKSNTGQVLETVVELAAAAILFYFRWDLGGWIPLVFAVWTLFNAVAILVSAFNYFKDGAPNYGAYFVIGIITLLLGLFLLANHYANILAFGIVAGIYIIWYGITSLFDTFNEERTQLAMSAAAKKMQRKLRIAIPSIVGALLPRKLLKDYDDKIASEDANAFLQSQNITVAEKKTLNPFNVEILIHLSKKFMESFGHVDLILGDEAISYGNFDGHSYRLGGAISDGVLFRCNRERYLYQSTHHDEKVLYAFKVAFSDEELKQIARNFERMKENMVPWYCDTQLAEQGLLPEGDYDDVADVIYKGNQAAFYKFTKGTLRTYFAVDTNCVKVADSIFEGTGFDKPAIPGIVTPGAYYEFLMQELEAPGTKVYERVLYAKETITEEPVI